MMSKMCLQCTDRAYVSNDYVGKIILKSIESKRFHSRATQQINYTRIMLILEEDRSDVLLIL